MKSPWLRKFRILIASVVFLAFFAALADFKNLIPAKYLGYLLYLQFVPSAIKYFDLRSMVAAGFIIVILLTILTGRSYCSFLCPLGIGQDIFSRIGGKIRRKFRRY